MSPLNFLVESKPLRLGLSKNSSKPVLVFKGWEKYKFKISLIEEDFHRYIPQFHLINHRKASTQYRSLATGWSVVVLAPPLQPVP
jgi:hypothetical protein